MKQLAIAFAAILCVGVAGAAQTPQPGPTDHRVRYVDYDANQVYQVTGFFGYHVTIMFAAGEKVLTASAGYADGWDIALFGGFVTLKPKARSPDTSLVVMTDRRTYVFDLRAKEPPQGRVTSQYATDNDQIFLLRFRYPEDERAAAAVAKANDDAARLAAERAAAEDKARLEAFALQPAVVNTKPRYTNYFYEGEEAIAPYEAWDDGTFTYFRFYAQSDLPTPFIVNEDGTESTANKHFEKDVMVVERTARQIILRKGKSIVCVYNENAPLKSAQPTTGATVPGGSRVLK
jgi:type IV secretion system protein VirB9